MGSRTYSFLDVAALTAVGPRLAAGDALVVLDAALSTVLWANGAGARLFGATDPLSFIGADPALRGPVRRQIEATSGFPRIGQNRNLVLRLAGGLFARTTAFSASEIAMPDGEAALLFAAAPARAQPNTAIEGLSGDGQYAALLDGSGTVIAAAEGFEGLRIPPDTLARLAADVRGEADRVVKRPLRLAAGMVPSGIVLLRDEPALSLLVVVDEIEDDADATAPVAAAPVEATAPAESSVQEAPPAEAPETERLAGVEIAPSEQPAEAPSATNEAAEGWYFNGPRPAAYGSAEASAPDEPASAETTVAESPVADAVAIAAPEPTEHPAPDTEQAPAALSAPVELSAVPVRFVWRTDAEGRFTAISDEFRAAFGAGAADVIGRRFADVSQVFGLDPSGEIAGLLARRDTWSGRSVLWPVAGTDLRAPVDLAALPVYGRERNFEGFRGFGVARMGDAVIDPEAIGVALGGGVVGISESAAPEASAEAPAADPFRGEPPAIAVAPTPERREADKVIRLAERRQTPGRDLSTAEQNNFREIGERLRDAGAETQRPANDPGRPALSPPAGQPVEARHATPASEAEDAVATAADPIEAADAAITELLAEQLGGELAAQAEGDAQPAQHAAEFLEPPLGTEREPVATVETAEVPPLEMPTEASRDDGPADAPARDVQPPASAPAETPQSVAEAVAAESDTAQLDLGAFVAASYDQTGGEGPATFVQVSEAAGTAAAPVENAAAATTETGSDATAESAAETVVAALSSADEALHTSAESAPIATPGEVDEARAVLPPALPESQSELAAAPPPPSGGDELIAALESPVEAADTSPAAAVAEEAAIADDAEVEAEPAEMVMPAETAVPAVAEVAPTEPALAESAASDSHSDETGSDAASEGVVSEAVSSDAAEVAADTAPTEPASAEPPLPEIRGVDAAVLSRLPLPIVIHRGDALFFANREFLELTGYASLEELDLAGGLGALFGDPYRHGDDRKLRLRTQGGAELPVDAHLQSVAWQGGKALLLSLKPLPEAAPSPAGDRDARLEELRTIIDTATDGVVLMEDDGTIRSISRPAEALFGYESEEVRGKPFASLFAIESQRAARDYLTSLADNGVASVLNDGREVIGRESQGGFIPLFMTIGRLPKASGFCAVVRDITQFKRTEEELTQARAQAERASSQKTDFLARVSHEIRTPLNAIIGFSELMLDEKFGPITNDRYKDYLRDINRSGNHVLDLVNDLLDISKIEAGQLEMNYEAVSLNETLADAVAMMQPQANRERVIIRSSFASRLPEVVADLRSIKQIALNLLSNAIRYTPAGGQVIVSTSYEPAGDILMRVRDTGIGMAAAEIEQALKPFKQINALKRPRGDGTGLGLPLTKAMVEANRARFAINSTPGEGTMVEITFPSTRVLAH
jgi:PAS domain S-box-containing protein